MNPRAMLINAVAHLDVERAPQYQPHDVTGDGRPETFCNFYAADVCRDLGAPLPQRTANEQLAWIVSYEGMRAGWDPCSAKEAVRCAEAGMAVVVGCTEQPHGHIAIVVPGPGPGVWITQAGAQCFACRPVGAGFGNRPVRYWVHAEEEAAPMIKDNRIVSPVTVANAAEDQRLDPIPSSPTGIALLPQLLVRVATVVVALAGTLLALTTQGIALPPIVVTVCTVVLALGTALGIASQGVRSASK